MEVEFRFRWGSQKSEPKIGIPNQVRKNKKSGHHFIYLEDYVIQRQMNKQSGFNVEQIEKDKDRRVLGFIQLAYIYWRTSTGIHLLVYWRPGVLAY